MVGQPGEVAGHKQHWMVGVGVRPDWHLCHIVGMGAPDPTGLEPWHPEAETLEQLVLPLSADVGGCQDQRPFDVSTPKEASLLLTPAEIVFPGGVQVHNQPGARILRRQSLGNFALVRERHHTAGRLSKCRRADEVGAASRNAGRRLAVGSSWRLFRISADWQLRQGELDQFIPDSVRKRIAP